MKAFQFIVGSISLILCACDPKPDSHCIEGGADGGVHCPPAVPCGGITGASCPGAGTCIDDTRDDCDPEDGGADCPGVCECNALSLCTEGYEFDRSPGACTCVMTDDPCKSVRCRGGTHCEVHDGRPLCVLDDNPCAVVLCKTGTECVVKDGAAVCVSTGGLACGSSTCAAGEYCCNASCGMCAPPGVACIQIACE
jgi:hypothetical protein